MQMHWTNSFLQRVLFSASKAYVQQLKTKQQSGLTTQENAKITKT
jgi:hypothetical protein